MIETVPLDQAANAYAKMMAGKARFRMVLTTCGPLGDAAPSIRLLLRSPWPLVGP
jgi:propanol-preferring alcohol dehydrogenase